MLLQLAELKALNLALGIEQSELRKVQDRLEECARHAAFLDNITPPEWFAAQTERYEAAWQVGPVSGCGAGGRTHHWWA